MSQLSCPCCSKKPFAECCRPYLQTGQPANSAEALMRSRFSAYAVGNFNYVLDTYAEEPRQSLSVDALSQDAVDTRWFALQVAEPGQDNWQKADSALVSFKAFYFYQGQSYLLHERSRFIKEAEKWCYLDGDIQTDSGPIKIKVNQPCPCNSGKKFKRCCASITG